MPSLIFKTIFFLTWPKCMSLPLPFRIHAPLLIPLTTILNLYYGISELALGWFKSNLSGRTNSAKVGSTLLHPAALQYGVPHGSILGPLLLSLYPIGSIIHSHSSINYQFYADDTYLYMTLLPENFSHSMQKTKELSKQHSKFYVCKLIKT